MTLRGVSAMEEAFVGQFARDPATLEGSWDEASRRSHRGAARVRQGDVRTSGSVPVNRVLMTYLETAAMNERFKEAETVLLSGPDNEVF